VQRSTVFGQQRLVGSNHALAVRQRIKQQRAGRLDAADDLDDEVDIVACDELGGVGRHEFSGDVRVSCWTTHCDAGEFEWSTDSRRELVSLFVEQSNHLRSDDTAAEQRDFQRIAHVRSPRPGSSRKRSSSVSRRKTTLDTPSRTLTTGGRGTWL
jgi:hypothetical protein